MDFSLIKKVWAQAPTTPPVNPFSTDRFPTLGSLLGFVMQIVFYVGISLTIIFLIIGGIRYIVSGGDKAGTEAARSMLTNAIIGFIVVIGAFAVKTILVNVLGATGDIPVTPPF